MKERPILFSAPMVKAILEGRKTQTRRALRVQPDSRYHSPIQLTAPGTFGFAKPNQGTEPFLVDCPYGKPGDRLWVRETFCIECGAEGMLPDIRPDRPYKDIEGDGHYLDDDRLIPHYRATDPEPELCYEDGPPCKRCAEGVPHAHWKPSIHMPRWASRITLEVTGVRVERLLDISESDCLAEGIRKERNRPDFCIGTMPFNGDSSDFYFDPFLEAWTKPAQNAYFGLWDLINGYESHKANPWVWVIDFKVLALNASEEGGGER